MFAVKFKMEIKAYFGYIRSHVTHNPGSCTSSQLYTPDQQCTKGHCIIYIFHILILIQ